MCSRQFHTADVPFSLVCRECDAGSHIEDHEQAVAEGWSDINYAPGLCRETIAHWPLTNAEDED